MFEVNESTTKKQIQAELERLEIPFGKKDNRDALIALLPTGSESPASPPTSSSSGTSGTGLKIEKDRPEQHGIKRPSIGGKCRAVWDACDAFAEREGDDPTAKDVKAMAEANGWNPNNASIEYYQWRKFNGITGRQPKPAAPAKADA